MTASLQKEIASMVIFLEVHECCKLALALLERYSVEAQRPLPMHFASVWNQFSGYCDVIIIFSFSSMTLI